MAAEFADFFRPTSAGQRVSLDAAMPIVYEELHRLAAVYMHRERDGHTLQPTALVNEAYLRLLTQHSVDFGNRAQVIGIAAQMMRRILRTYDKQHGTNKRGGDATMVYLSDAPEPADTTAPVVFSQVDETLDRLAKMDERQAKVVELRIFGGMTIQETAEYLEISTATANRDWASGRLWLASELRRSA